MIPDRSRAAPAFPLTARYRTALYTMTVKEIPRDTVTTEDQERIRGDGKQPTTRGENNEQNDSNCPWLTYEECCADMIRQTLNCTTIRTRIC